MIDFNDYFYFSDSIQSIYRGVLVLVLWWTQHLSRCIGAGAMVDAASLKVRWYWCYVGCSISRGALVLVLCRMQHLSRCVGAGAM